MSAPKIGPVERHAGELTGGPAKRYRIDVRCFEGHRIVGPREYGLAFSPSEFVCGECPAGAPVDLVLVGPYSSKPGEPGPKRPEPVDELGRVVEKLRAQVDELGDVVERLRR